MISANTIERIRMAIDLQTLAASLAPMRAGKIICPYHDDQKPSCHVYQNGFKCFACGEYGDSFKLLMALGNVSFPEAAKWLAGEAGIALDGRPDTGTTQPALSMVRRAPEPVEPVEPRPDTGRLAQLLTAARHELETPAAQPWIEWRGIPVETLIEYDVGFMRRLHFDNWPGWEIGPAWVLPISRADGAIVAVKLHRERPASGPKALWAPLGTTTDQRTGKPRHGFKTLWPAPETFFEAEDERAAIVEHSGFSRADAERLSGWSVTELFVCPGELKSLAILAAGKAATSVTAGEGHRWTPGQIARVRAHRVVIVFDDDPSGHRFRDATLQALAGHISDLRAITFGEAPQ